MIQFRSNLLSKESKPREKKANVGMGFKMPPIKVFEPTQLRSKYFKRFEVPKQ